MIRVVLMWALAFLCALVAAERWITYRKSRSNVLTRAHQLYRTTQATHQSLFTRWAERFDQSEHGKALALKLARANLRMRPVSYTLIRVASMALLFLFGSNWLQLNFPLDLLLPWVAAWLVERMLFKARGHQFAAAVNKQLVEATRLLSSGLKAGMSVQQAFDLAGHDLAKPAGPVFARAYQEMQLGVPLPEALDKMRGRVQSTELDLLVNTLVLHHDTGGNLAHALDLIAGTLAEREQVQSQIETATAEQRFVAQLLPILPLFAGLMMNLFIPGFLNPLFKPLGLVVLSIFLVLQFAALAVIRRIGRIEV